MELFFFIAFVLRVIVCKLINIWVTGNNLLKMYSNSDFREKIKEVLLMLCLVIFTGLLIAYVVFGNLPLLNNYVIVDAKLPDKDKSQDYIVLLEYKNQYYVSEFEIIGEEIKIFNGEYWIISKEGIKIRNQQFNGTVKTNKSRDEYYVQSQSPSSATMNGS